MTLRPASATPRRRSTKAESSRAATPGALERGVAEARGRGRGPTGSGFSGPGGVDDLALASLLASRICHDLASPIGAIYNGVEVIESGDPGREDFIKMICANARLTRCRLDFLRAAFGVSSGREGGLQLSEVRALADGMFDANKFRLDWAPGELVLSLCEARLLLNQILIASEALIRGGRIEVGVVQREKLQLIVIATGLRVKFETEDEALLLRGELPADARLAPKKAPILLTYRLARQLGAQASHVVRESERESEFVLAYAA